jgi:hypothetical protein
MAKHELIEPKPSDIRYIRRDEKGHFTEEQDEVGRPHSGDQGASYRGHQCASPR